MTAAAAVAVIGGSGLYRLFDEAEARIIPTPYGDAEVSLGDLNGRRAAFLTRHGSGHAHAPHLIRYRANIWALASLGVRAIVSTAAVGSISPALPPGALALPDQFIDRTSGRADTFFDEGSVQHLAAADPFCPELRSIALDALGGIGETVAPTATVVVIQGPRFSTRAESRWYAAGGGDLVNMTLVPEVPLAAELGIGTVNLSFVTDTDAGEPDADDEPVSAELVFARLAAAQPRLIAALSAIVAAIPADYAPRELIAPAEIAAVLARPVLDRPVLDRPVR
jgi:5'-methylthioadenosine phosphorylase